MDGRDGSGDSAQPRRSDPPDPSYPPQGEGQELGEWLARDGVWRRFATDPPAVAGEVVDTRVRRDDTDGRNEQYADFGTWNDDDPLPF